MPIARPIAGLPSKRKRAEGGSTYPRLIVAMSLRRKKRSLTCRLTERMLSSEENWPPTRMLTRSPSVWMTPDGDTAFCACSVSITCCWLMPSAASWRGENSR
ncbi:hypothetical protein D3C87_1533750 [compost metagenome]